MDENDVYKIIDDLDEKSLLDVMSDFTINDEFNDEVNEIAKKKIKNKMCKKIKVSRRKRIFKYKPIKALVVGFVLIVGLIILINVNSNVASALSKVPALEKIVQLVTFNMNGKEDLGFESLIENGKYDEINTTVTDDNMEFTVTTVAGDSNKLWIGYKCNIGHNEIGNIKFIDTETNEELNWTIIYRTLEDEGYIEVDVDELVSEFTIEIDICNSDINNIDFNNSEECLNYVNENTISTLLLPIELSENIVSDSGDTYMINKSIDCEMEDLRLEKINVSDSRTRLYFSVNGDKYSSISFQNLRIVDSDNNSYYALKNATYSLSGNGSIIAVDIDGTIENISQCEIKCDGVSYVKAEDGCITVDLQENIVKENNLGITLLNADENTIILNVPNGNIEFAYYVLNDLGEEYIINSGEENGTEYSFEFTEIEGSEINFYVTSIPSMNYDGFSLQIS